jgi:hypothetical protein
MSRNEHLGVKMSREWQNNLAGLMCQNIEGTHCVPKRKCHEIIVIAECKIESAILNKVQLTVLFTAESQVPVAVMEKKTTGTMSLPSCSLIEWLKSRSLEGTGSSQPSEAEL